MANKMTQLTTKNVKKLSPPKNINSVADVSFRELANAMPQLVWSATPDGQFDYWNEKISEFKLPVKLKKIDLWKHLVHPDDKDRTQEAWNQAISLGKMFEIQHQLKMNDGQYRWFLSRAEPIRANGRVKRWYGVTTDIHHQKETQAALQDSKERLKLAQAVGNIGTFEWDVKQKTVAWSEESEKMYGLAPGEFEGTQKAWEKRVHPDDLDKVYQDYHAALKSGSFMSEWRALLPDKSTAHILAKGKIFYNHKDQPTRFVGVHVDVSQLKHAQSELSNRINQQAVVTQLGLNALAGMDVQKLMELAAERLKEVLDVDFVKILELMPSGKKFLLRAGIGWKKSVANNKTIIGAGKNSQAGQALLRKTPVVVKDLPNDKRFSGPQLLISHKVISGISCIIYGQNRAFGAIGVHSKTKREFSEYDVNLLQAIANVIAMAIQRKNDEQLKDEFLGIASHELKTPLTSIKAYTQMMSSMFKEHKASEYLIRMERQIDKLTNLINDLLDVTKIQSGKLELDMSTFNFNQLVSEVIEDLSTATNSHHIEIKLGETCHVKADRRRIEQVITNLITNAVKYSPEAKKVSVFTKCINNEAHLYVKDYGLGIPKNKQKKIFQRFYRIKGEKNSKLGGLGLGLHIASEIIKQHRGTIWFESQIGKGTTFCFNLPHAPQEE